MLSAIILPIALALSGAASADAPEEARTEIALNYASEYIDFNKADVSVAPQLGSTCKLVGDFGVFCTYKCGGVLVLDECGNR